MESIARLVVSATELMEAEGRVLKRSLIRLALLAVCSIAAAIAVAIGVCFIMAGIYRGLTAVVGPAWAAVIIGAGWIVLGVLAVTVLPGLLAPKSISRAHAKRELTPAERAAAERDEKERERQRLGLREPPLDEEPEPRPTPRGSTATASVRTGVGAATTPSTHARPRSQVEEAVQ